MAAARMRFCTFVVSGGYCCCCCCVVFVVFVVVAAVVVIGAGGWDGGSYRPGDPAKNPATLTLAKATCTRATI